MVQSGCICKMVAGQTAKQDAMLVAVSKWERRVIEMHIRNKQDFSVYITPAGKISTYAFAKPETATGYRLGYRVKFNDNKKKLKNGQQ